MQEYKIDLQSLFAGGSIAINPAWLVKIKDAIEKNNIELSADLIAKMGSPAKSSGVTIIPVDSTGKNSESIAVLDITGVLVYSGPEWLEMFGYQSYQTIARRFDQLMADSRIKTIVLRVQSPGGSTFGVRELSDKIFNARSEKKIVAIADPYAFSAAYWLASAASSFYSLASGMIGSVGVYTMHSDYSKMLEDDGVKVTFIKAGEKKIDGNFYQPLSESAKKDIQAEVDQVYGWFVADIARNRGVSEAFALENFGKGGTVMPDTALSVGMIDGLYTFEDILNMELRSVSETITIALHRAKRLIQREKDLINLED